MTSELRDIEPFYGWLALYSHENDPKSPFYEVAHNLFEFDRSINHIPAHPLWDDIGSESLLVKILFANYQQGFAIIELFGEWNDLFDNDFRLLSENCLSYLVDHGINKFILICENVFHIYLEEDDYYRAMEEELGEGWIFALRLRKELKDEMRNYGIAPYFYWSEKIDSVNWRGLKPPQLYKVIDSRLHKLLG